MIKLSRTEVIWLQDELKQIHKAVKKLSVRNRCETMITALDRAVERRKKEVDASLTREAEARELQHNLAKPYDGHT